MLGMLGLKSKYVHSLGSSLVMLFDHRNGYISTVDVDGVLRETLKPGEPGYEEARCNAFPDVKVGDEFTAADKLAQDCAYKRVAVAMVIRMAKGLLSEDGENSEYDRAIVELVIDVCGLSQQDFDTVLATIRNFDEKKEKKNARA